MRHYFSPSQNSSFRGRQRITLPSTSNKDLVRTSKHFNFSQGYGLQQSRSLQDLDRLIELGHDRQLRQHLCSIFEATQADGYPDNGAREYYYL